MNISLDYLYMSFYFNANMNKSTPHKHKLFQVEEGQ